MNAENTKLFEIRDRGTLVPAMAVKMSTDNPQEQFLLSKAGYSRNTRCTLLIMLATNECRYDAHDWGRHRRTMITAHSYIQENFDLLVTGAVVDVEYILGETKEAKVSELVSTIADLIS